MQRLEIIANEMEKDFEKYGTPLETKVINAKDSCDIVFKIKFPQYHIPVLIRLIFTPELNAIMHAEIKYMTPRCEWSVTALELVNKFNDESPFNMCILHSSYLAFITSFPPCDIYDITADLLYDNFVYNLMLVQKVIPIPEQYITTLDDEYDDFRVKRLDEKFAPAKDIVIVDPNNQLEVTKAVSHIISCYLFEYYRADGIYPTDALFNKCLKKVLKTIKKRKDDVSVRDFVRDVIDKCVKDEMKEVNLSVEVTASEAVLKEIFLALLIVKYNEYNVGTASFLPDGQTSPGNHIAKISKDTCKFDMSCVYKHSLMQQVNSIINELTTYKKLMTQGVTLSAKGHIFNYKHNHDLMADFEMNHNGEKFTILLGDGYQMIHIADMRKFHKMVSDRVPKDKKCISAYCLFVDAMKRAVGNDNYDIGITEEEFDLLDENTYFTVDTHGAVRMNEVPELKAVSWRELWEAI